MAASPSRACFAQAHERCRAAGGASRCARWHAVSAHEHFCQDCVDFYGRGEGWHLWQAEQEAGGKCSTKELVVRLHLPVWAQCMRAACGKWRILPARTQLSEGWHCGLVEQPLLSLHGASTRHRPSCAACSSPEDPRASLPEPAEDASSHRSPPLPPFLAPPGEEAAVESAVAAARLAWHGLSYEEAATHRDTPLALTPLRCVALRNLLLWLWQREGGTRRVWARDAMRAVCCAGLGKIWSVRSLPAVLTHLERLGWINFGALPQFTLRMPPSAATPRRSVIVIGAGLAGLAAAAQLRRMGHSVTVLEAQKRLGGRVLTEEVCGVPIDLGAMIIVGTTGNPLVTLARQAGCELHRLDGKSCPLLDGPKQLSAAVDTQAEATFTALMEEAGKQRAIRKGKRAHIGISNGGRWDTPHEPPKRTKAQAKARQPDGTNTATAAAHGKSLGDVVDQLVKQAKLPPQQARAVQWHVANLEYGCATPLNQVGGVRWEALGGRR
jgi:hypothetical protein